MLEHGTWPVPIIVLDNAAGICTPDDEPMARWHLFEGHMRSAYLDQSTSVYIRNFSALSEQ